MLNTTKALKIEDVEWELICEPEDTPLEGNVMASGDDDADAEAEQWVRDQLDSGNQWGWCFVRLVGRFKGLQCWDGLGCCSYQSEADFRQCGYYDDMQAEVLRQLTEEAANIAEFFTD
jgi:hypothetical protein